jgi:hypothetical protein
LAARIDQENSRILNATLPNAKSVAIDVTAQLITCRADDVIAGAADHRRQERVVACPLQQSWQALCMEEWQWNC